MTDTTDFVLVKHTKAPEDSAPGKVPAAVLNHWEKKGFVQVDEDGNPVAVATDPEKPAAAASGEPAEGAPAPVTEADGKQSTNPTDPRPVEGEGGTAAGSADDPTTLSEPTQAAPRGTRRPR